MNNKQRKASGLGILLVLVMSLFPPWIVIYDIPEQKLEYTDIPKRRVERSGGYRFLLEQHDSALFSKVIIEGEYTLANVTTRIDYFRLAIQIGIVMILAGIACLLFRSEKSK
jgi:ABC-type antimicrobial peptide transport system permease subunit